MAATARQVLRGKICQETAQFARVFAWFSVLYLFIECAQFSSHFYPLPNHLFRGGPSPPTHGRKRPPIGTICPAARPPRARMYGFPALVRHPTARARARLPTACARGRSPAAIAATSLAAAPASRQPRGPRRAPRASLRAPPPGAGLRPSPADIALRCARSARRAPPVALRAPGAPERLTCRAAIIRCPDLLISE